MTHHGRGTFAVSTKPLPQQPDGVGRFSLDKQIHGDLEATSRGEMLAYGNPASGEAGYVAMEVVTGTLAGRHGTFALQHVGTMGGGALSLTVTVVPGSGTGGLKGLAGTFTIRQEGGQHFYDFAYTLPQ